MRVNGDAMPHRPGLTLHQLLAQYGVNQRAVVVMQNEEIHRAGSIPDAPVSALDDIEIVTMMQGG